MACIDPGGGRMPSRQDQLHSYQFMIQRVVAALVMRETDPSQSPFRRAMGATMVSLLVAALAMGGVAAYAFFKGVGATNNKDENVVLIEKETGANFVRKNGRLYPVLNHASAVLFAQKNDKRSVSQSSLRNQAREPMVGIPGAPASILAPNQLVDTPWTICSTTEQVGAKPISVLKVGAEPRDGTAFAERESIVVKGPDGGYSLLWHGNRYPLRDMDRLGVFGNLSSAAPVANAFLNVFPVGPEIGPIVVTDRGKVSQKVTGRKIGGVLRIMTDGVPQNYVVLDKGVAPVSALQVDIMLADAQYPAFSGLTNVAEVEPSTITSYGIVQATPANGIPDTNGSQVPLPPLRPQIIDQTIGLGNVCASTRRDADPGPDVDTRDGSLSVLRYGVKLDSTEPNTPGISAARAPLADRVEVQPGFGALVQDMTVPGRPAGSLAIVQDGQRFNMTPAVRDMLGFGSVKPIPVLTSLGALIPQGPALDVESAAKPVPPVQGPAAK
jgi:type VII secretion protein EccB